jgi:hypothetical protein
MIKIDKTEVFGWESAIRGMRNPMNSWDKSDSDYKTLDTGDALIRSNDYIVGPNDLKLMKSLSKAGPDHGKFLRMINVTCDINAPLYWWKEFDTYKIGTVANSCSTMHKIHDKEFTIDDFSCEHLHDEAYDCLTGIIYILNDFRRRFINYKDKEDWWQLIQLLPSSYNQKRTVQLNYQVLKNMYNARKHHKLDEWKFLCVWCETLPYFKEICLGEDNDGE